MDFIPRRDSSLSPRLFLRARPPSANRRYQSCTRGRTWISSNFHRRKFAAEYHLSQIRRHPVFTGRPRRQNVRTNFSDLGPFRRSAAFAPRKDFAYGRKFAARDERNHGSFVVEIRILRNTECKLSNILIFSQSVLISKECSAVANFENSFRRYLKRRTLLLYKSIYH